MAGRNFGSFGPGSIGWALTEHYWLTGDKKWLREVALRIKANAEWMLRQRQVMSNAVPGGERPRCCRRDSGSPRSSPGPAG